MFFQRIKTPGIAHNAYVIGSQGEAAVVDPRRDIDEYLRVARDNKLTIKLIIETHRQEDFEIGAADLAERTGAKIVTGEHELFGLKDIGLKDGETVPLGELTIRAIHTPGHTPESTSYAVFLKETPEKAWGVFTGDTLFVGEAGRTDLSDAKKTAENAGILFDSVHKKLLPLGDQTLLFPAHGSGSVCGGNIAERDESTMGLEQSYNPVFTKSREEFAAAKAAERLSRPPYFIHMEKVNLKGGRPLARGALSCPIFQPKQFHSEMQQGIVIDTRDPEAFAGGHIAKSYSIWLAGLPVFSGWICRPGEPVYLLTEKPEHTEKALQALARVGVDEVQGFLAGGFDAWRDSGMEIERSGTLSPQELAERRDRFIPLDVREIYEYEDKGHIPGALNILVGDLEQRISELKAHANDHIVVICSVGHRASLGVSILKRQGFKNVSNLLGGMTAWYKLGLPTRKGPKADENQASA